MLDELSLATTGSREWRRRVRLDFLMAELQTGHVSASLAMTSNDPARAAWYRDLGWEAHDAVVRFRPTVSLSYDEDKQIRAELASLESMLNELAEPQGGASNGDRTTGEERVPRYLLPRLRRLRATR